MELAIFDLDGTLIDGQSQMFLVLFLFKKKKIKIISLILILFWFLGYKIKLFKNPNWVFNYAAKILAKGRSFQEVSGLVKEFHEQILKTKYKNKIVEILKKYQKDGWRVVLLSTAIKPLADEVAHYLDIKEVVATKLECFDNIYTGKILGEILYGRAKAEAAEKIFSEEMLSGSSTYFDHYSDIFLAKKCGKLFLVDPRENTLLFYKKNLNNRFDIIYS